MSRSTDFSFLSCPFSRIQSLPGQLSTQTPVCFNFQYQYNPFDVPIYTHPTKVTRFINHESFSVQLTRLFPSK